MISDEIFAVLKFEPTPEQAIALEQIDAFLRAPSGGFMALSGVAGSGKTTCLRELCAKLPSTMSSLTKTEGALHGATAKKATLAWAAMTGKAAQRLTEVTGNYARTLHSTLYEKPDVDFEKLSFTELQTPTCKVLVVDECSMVTPKIYEDLQVWTNGGVKVLIVGDFFQLPPILDKDEEKKWGQDFTIFREVRGPTLTKVMRSTNEIVTVATAIRETKMASRTSQGAYEFRLASDPTQAAVDDYLADPDDHMLITWTNETRMDANLRLRKQRSLQTFMAKNEPILICKNGQGLLNGDVKRVLAVEPGPAIGAIQTLYMTFDGVPNPVLVSPRGKAMFDGLMPYIADRKKWFEYRNELKRQNLPEPVPVTYAYARTCHKCVHPDTLVETANGLERIKDIRASGRIATPKGMHRYKNKVINPSAAMLRITTKEGYTLDVTPDHGIFIWEGMTQRRVDAQDVPVGAHIQFALHPGSSPKKNKRLPALSTPLDVRTRQYKLPTRMTGAFAELLGLMVGDGTLFPSGIRLGKRHQEVGERFRDLVKRLFGYSCTYEYRNHAHLYTAHSTQIAAWLAEFDGLAPNQKAIPRCILQASLREQAHFLRGLFEDGSVSVKADRLDHIEWGNVTPAVVRTVQVMLLRFGIIASYSAKYNRLWIYGENAKRFAAKIGFISKLKNDRLAKPTSQETTNKVPLSSEELATITPFWSKHDQKRRRILVGNLVSRRALNDLMRRPDLIPTRVRRLLKAKLAWHYSPVVSVTRIRDSTSMCVEVPHVGRFLQNGSPQSNCQGDQARRVTVFLKRDELISYPFMRMTTLPNGEKVSFGVRWLYTSITRAKERVTLILDK